MRDAPPAGLFGIALLATVVLAGCRNSQPAAEAPPAATPALTVPAGTQGRSLPPIGSTHLQVRGTQFIRPDGSPFQWRGISAFRLVEMIARGRRNEVAAYLDWAASQQLTVVRVLTMATHLFPLTPEDGVRALPDLLEMAAARGLYVEVVALADTGDMPVAIDAHVTAVGEIAAQHPNALVEIANEPIHPTQAPRIHEPDEVARLARLVPDPVPVALGSAEEHEGFSSGDYATFHFPRDSGRGGWGYVVELARGAALLEKWNRPLVNDEPIGAAAALIPGRRDNDPARFRAAALMTRLTGMGGTFHYEGGLQAAIPSGRELESFNAWNEAWTLLPADVEREGVFRRAGDPGAAVQSFDETSAVAVFERQQGTTSRVLVLGVRGEPALTWQPGWTVDDTRRLDGAWLVTASRSNAGSASDGL